MSESLQTHIVSPKWHTQKALNNLVHLVPLTIPAEASQFMPAQPELLHLRWLVSFTASTDALKCSSSLFLSSFDRFHMWTGCNVVSFYLFVYCAASPAAFPHRDRLGMLFSCRSETKALPLGVAQGLRYQLLERFCKRNKCEDNETVTVCLWGWTATTSLKAQLSLPAFICLFALV